MSTGVKPDAFVSNHLIGQHDIALNSEVLDYKDSWVIQRLVIPRLEIVDKMPYAQTAIYNES